MPRPLNQPYRLSARTPFKRIFMKKLIVALCLMSFVATTYAQNSFRFGLQGTGGLSWFKTDTKGLENDGARLNYNFGLMFDKALGEGSNYYLSTGINMATLNGKLKYPDLIYPNASDSSTYLFGTSQSKYSLNYVEIPVLLKMRTNEVGYMHYFGVFGVSGGFNTRARMTLEQNANGQTYSPDDELDVADDIRLMRVGLDIGFGVEYNLTGNTYAMAMLSYHNGFTNLFNADYYELDATDNSQVALDEDKLIEDPNNSGTFVPYLPKEGPTWKTTANNLRLTVGIFF